MSRALTLSLPALLVFGASVLAQDGPTMEDMVRSPADYAGKVWTYNNVALSGTITPAEVAGVRKYYLTVGSRAGTIEPGFFLVPPSMADALGGKMDPRKNYRINLTFAVQKLTINDVPEWHGIVTRVDFLDADGQVTDTVKQAKKGS